MDRSPAIRSIRLSALALSLALAGALVGIGAGVASAHGGFGFGGGRGRLHGCSVVDGRVTAVSSTSITVAAAFGRQCEPSSTTTTAAPTTTVAPTTIASDTAKPAVTISDVTFGITTDTAIISDGYTLTTAQIAIGDHVLVYADPSNTANASSIHVDAILVAGRVSAVSGSDVTVGRGVWSTTLVLETYTLYRGGTSSDVITGARVEAVGVKDPSTKGEVDALAVRILKRRTPATTTTTVAPTTTTTS